MEAIPACYTPVTHPREDIPACYTPITHTQGGYTRLLYTYYTQGGYTRLLYTSQAYPGRLYPPVIHLSGPKETIPACYTPLRTLRRRNPACYTPLRTLR